LPENEKVLVTGADGFIGSHVVETLVEQGYDVRAFVFYNSFNSWGWLDHSSDRVRNSIEVVAGDIRDPHGTRRAVAGCDAVLHLAALIAIPFSYHSPSAYVDTNVTGTLNLLEAARDLGVKRFVSTSTSEVYGSAQYVPIDENHPLVGQSPYAATKIGADQIALSFYRSYEMPVTVLRPFNTFGPRQSARAVIPTIISQLAAGKSELRLGALTPTRDFNYVRDIAQGFVAMISAPDVIGEVINIGTGYEISIGDLAEMIADVMGVKAKIVADNKRYRPEKSEVDRLCANAEKAASLIGWAPEFVGRDGLRDALSETITWFCDPENLRHYKADIYNI
jgi:NAD dependent epimerase/dehydratase